MSREIDLKSLAVRRDPSRPDRGRNWTTRLLLPATILLGFAALIGYAIRERLDPAKSVTVVPVLTTRTQATRADEPIFQAAGWIEPRPGPTLVTALTEGVVDELVVVEGQEVKADQPVARLNSADAKLAVESAGNDVLLREAELAAAQAASAAARVRFDRPSHLQAELAEAEAVLARTELELANLPNLRRIAEVRSRQAKQDLELKRQGSVASSVVLRAEAEAEAAAAAVDELQIRIERLPAEIAAHARKREALRDRLDLRTDERRLLAEAEAGLRVADAKLRQARNAVQAASLRLERCLVRSPAAGRIMALTVRPGTHVSGGHDPGTVALLYEPKSVQARVDVRLEDVSRVETGMSVRIESAAMPGKTVAGSVLLVTSQADIQKNTLSVKVALPDPPAQLRPDMLVRVTFLAPARANSNPGSNSLRLLVPRTLVEGGGASARIWIADRVAGKAALRTVTLGSIHGELVEVTAGLDPSDKVIAGGRDGLVDGQRISVTGEDDSLGLSH